MAAVFLDFEQPLRDIEGRIEELAQRGTDAAVQEQIAKLRKNSKKTLQKIYGNLSVWQQVQIARHPERPHTTDYVHGLFTGFDQLHGDRRAGDDQAVIGGMARFEGRPVMVMGHEKGRDTRDKIDRNFGMPHPEGFRKAYRLMQLAERYRMPVICFIDTAGAYPGVEAEERGQSEAIAANLALLSRLRTPVIVSIIGEGGSGGALALSIGDRVGIMSHAIYSVASPEACASIIWRDASKAESAATAMRVDAAHLHKIGFADELIEEPLGGAHRDYDQAYAAVGNYIRKALKKTTPMGIEKLVEARYQRIMSYGKLSQPE